MTMSGHEVIEVMHLFIQTPEKRLTPVWKAASLQWSSAGPECLQLSGRSFIKHHAGGPWTPAETNDLLLTLCFLCGSEDMLKVEGMDLKLSEPITAGHLISAALSGNSKAQDFLNKGEKTKLFSTTGWMSTLKHFIKTLWCNDLICYRCV